MSEPPIIRVHRDDHEAVIAYYKARKLDVKCVHDPSVRWPLSEPAVAEYDRYSDLSD